MTDLPFIEGAELPTFVMGRPFDERLAALDDEAARAVIAKTFASCREAAKHFAPRYVGRAYEGFDAEARNDKIRYIQRRIARRHLALLSPST